VVEVELKVEVPPTLVAELPLSLQALGWVPEGCEAITDYYLEFTPSPLGGYDFVRVRTVNGAYQWTRKRWAPDPSGASMRLEEEHALTPLAFQAAVDGAGTALQLVKVRRPFAGRIDAWAATIVLDTLTLGGPPRTFLECEILTTPPQAAAARLAIQAWVRAHLPGLPLTEAPSMLALLLGA
jgi:hypothetical protein